MFMLKIISMPLVTGGYLLIIEYAQKLETTGGKLKMIGEELRMTGKRSFRTC